MRCAWPSKQGDSHRFDKVKVVTGILQAGERAKMKRQSCPVAVGFGGIRVA